MRVLPGLLFLAAMAIAADDDDVADLPYQDLKVKEDASRRYFLIGPRKEAKPPREGFGLLVVMPGGDGGAGFLNFVRRICKNALDETWIAAQLVSVKWKEDQQIIWPTGGNRVEGMKFTTEEFVESVVEEVKKRLKVNPRRVLVLAWSSSGPAAYAISLQQKKSTTGYYIAMSVFKPNELPPLESAKGERYWIDHSPQDKVCPYRMAQEAEEKLKKEGAKVKMVTYEGGHGWHGNLYGRLRDGFAWLCGG